MESSFNAIKTPFFVKDQEMEEIPRVSWLDHLEVPVIVVYVGFVTYSVFNDFAPIPNAKINLMIIVPQLSWVSILVRGARQI